MALGLRGATEGGEVERGDIFGGVKFDLAYCGSRQRGAVSAAYPSGKENYTRVLLSRSILLRKHDNVAMLSFALMSCAASFAETGG